MRVVTLVFLAFGTLISSEAAATDWGTLMATEPQARWNACYKETRLLLRTRNMSEQQYRVVIKAARRAHMQDCMARAEPPRPTAIPEIDEKHPKGAIAGWARNP
jgi:hypothetical protein